MLDRQEGGGQGQGARAQHHDRPAGEGVVAGEKRAKGVRAHDARLVPALERQSQIAGARGEDQLAETAKPGGLIVRQADHWFGQGVQSRAIDEGAPGVGPEGDLDPGLERRFERRIGAEDLFEHAALALHRSGGPAAVVERNVQADQSRGDGILVHQEHAGAALCGLDGGAGPRRAGADHHHVEAFLRRLELSGDGVGVVWWRRAAKIARNVHQTASRAWARSATRSSGCSSPTEMRIVPSVMPTSSRRALGVA